MEKWEIGLIIGVILIFLIIVVLGLYFYLAPGPLSPTGSPPPSCTGCTGGQVCDSNGNCVTPIPNPFTVNGSPVMILDTATSYSTVPIGPSLVTPNTTCCDRPIGGCGGNGCCTRLTCDSSLCPSGVCNFNFNHFFGSRLKIPGSNFVWTVGNVTTTSGVTTFSLTYPTSSGTTGTVERVTTNHYRNVSAGDPSKPGDSKDANADIIAPDNVTNTYPNNDNQFSEPIFFRLDQIGPGLSAGQFYLFASTTSGYNGYVTWSTFANQFGQQRKYQISKTAGFGYYPARNLVTFTSIPSTV